MIRLIGNDEEWTSVYVGTKHIADITFEDLGWYGIEFCEELVRNLAKELDVKVIDE